MLSPTLIYKGKVSLFMENIQYILHKRDMSHLDIEQANEVLENKLSEIPTVTEWAANLGYDRTIFSRKYRSITGRKPKEVLANYRLVKIIDLLENTLLCFYEIAEEAALNNYKVLYTFCKQQTDCTPTQLRERLRNGEKDLGKSVAKARTNR